MVLVIAMVIVTTKKMYLMEDPEIKNYILPLSKQEKIDLGGVNLAD